MRPLNVELLQSIGVNHLLGGEYEADLVRLASTIAAGDDTFVPTPRHSTAGPDCAVAGRIAATRPLRDVAARGCAARWSATRRRAAAASTPAATVRSCRGLRRAASVSCTWMSYLLTLQRRWSRARSTSRSVIPISSTASGHAMAGGRGGRAAVSRSDVRRHHQGRAPARARPFTAAVAPRPVACS